MMHTRGINMEREEEGWRVRKKNANEKQRGG